MDKKIFAEKFSKLGFDKKAFEAIRQSNTKLIKKLDTYSQDIIGEEIALFIRAADTMDYILDNDYLYAYINNFMFNFVSENLEYLQFSASLDNYKALIAEAAGISQIFLPKFFFPQKTTCNYKTKKHFGPQIEAVISLLSGIITEKQQVLWLICYYFTLILIVERLSIKWVNRYPQFESIDTKNSALYAYVLREYPNANDEFPFSCWLFYKEIEAKSLQEINQYIGHEIEAVRKEVESSEIKRKLLQFKNSVIEEQSAICKKKVPITMKSIDNYSGAEFEAFIGSIFEEDGYQIEFTQVSNDKGIDIIARRNGISIGIQCKRYSGSVGISSVQEVFSGKNFYSLDKALVVTNNYFTASAKDLAKSTGVILWDRDILISKISLL